MEFIFSWLSKFQFAVGNQGWFIRSKTEETTLGFIRDLKECGLWWCVGGFEVVTHSVHHQYQERVLYVTLIFVSWLKISDK